MGCDVVTVSTDTKYTHRAWRMHEPELAEVRYPMGSDASGRIGRAFGVYDDGSGLALRGTFIINPEGILLASEMNFYNLGRNIDELMRKFKANIYLAKKTITACPSKWKDDGGTPQVRPASSGSARSTTP
jgi:NADH-dependent peroxiredoxin subunit C